MTGLASFLQGAFPYLTFFVPMILAMVGTVAAVYFVHRSMSRQEQDRRFEDKRIAHTRQRLDEFYGPMLAMVAELEQRRQVFQKIRDDIANLHTKHKQVRDFRKAERYSQEAQFLTIKAADRYRQVELPVLKDMVMLFRYKGWLAAPSTQTHLSALLNVLELSELQAEKRPTLELLAEVAQAEDVIALLSEDLQLNHQILLAAASEETLSYNYAVHVVPRNVEAESMRSIQSEAVDDFFAEGALVESAS